MGFRLSAITAGRVSFVAMLILGPVIAPGMMPGPGLPGVCGPGRVPPRRGRIGWLRRLR